MIHYLKVWPEFIEPLKKGLKTFEIRKHDRNYQVNDILVLQEWDPKTEKYTGEEIRKKVTYILFSNSFPALDEYVLMSIVSVP